MKRRHRRGGPRSRRRRDRERLPISPFNIHTPTEWRQYLSVIFDEAMIESALFERHLIPELPASIWIDFERMLHRMQRVPPRDWKEFCATQPPILLQLIVLFILDFDATVRAMQPRLSR